jgi:hypothetical protein
MRRVILLCTLGVATVATVLTLPACGSGTTDCYESSPMIEGRRPSNGEVCFCTFFYQSPDDGSGLSGPPCAPPKCTDADGDEISELDCDAQPPF